MFYRVEKPKWELLRQMPTTPNEQLNETLQALIKQEGALTDYEQQLNGINQQLAVAIQLQGQQLEKIQVLEGQLAQSMKEQHEADKRAAVAEARCVELEKQLAKQEKEVVRLKEKK